MARQSRFLLAVVAPLVLVGCRTPYMAYDCEPTGNPWPLTGWNCKGGYSELELSPETYQVSFSGREITSAKAQDYALLRAAELTLERGHRYFFVKQGWGQTDVQLHGGPQSSQTIPTGENGFFTLGSGGGTTSMRLPQASYIIRIIRDEEEETMGPNVYDAVTIQASIRGKYRLGGTPAVAADR